MTHSITDVCRIPVSIEVNATPQNNELIGWVSTFWNMLYNASTLKYEQLKEILNINSYGIHVHDVCMNAMAMTVAVNHFPSVCL